MSLTYTPLDEIPNIHATARRAFLSGKTKSIVFRKRQIAQVAWMVKDNEQRFMEAMKADLGRPYQETEFFDFGIVYGESRMAYDNIEKWTKEQAPDFNPNWFLMKPRLKPEPKGVVLVIAPFNYPLFLLLVPLISAIAGGNAAVLKPPENTPVFSALLAELLPEYLDKELFHVVNGAVAETTKLLELPWDHIMYTGNGRVGRIVAEAAAKHLTPLTLELGGKNPVIVDPKVDLEMAARRIFWGRTSNAGQICLAPEYVLVPEESQAALVSAFRNFYHSFFPEGAKKSDSFGRIVTEAHAARIKNLIEQTRGTIEFGGDVDIAEKYVSPTVVSNVRADDPLMEIFGPVLAIVPVKDIDEAIAFINSRDVPLAIYVFSFDKALQKKVVDNTQSGAIMMNETLVTAGAPGLPVGGKGPGGYGYYTSKYGFDQFVHMRVSVNNPAWVDKLALWFRFPPYTVAGGKKIRSLETPLPPRPTDSESSISNTWVVLLATAVAAASSVAVLRAMERV
ncbi:aldehyde dehydrogenase [Trametes coccinea BRFM310]|uniref:Aldehyde dehydrogenase n=1 Tax=Trametes coccinea (strain BRFM310) TaxID=1353009 RepID=A0A1Y2I717_TRAC3|nr:aldehyde dehydrogenase [Trametes coccinea BRFM310]